MTSPTTDPSPTSDPTTSPTTKPSPTSDPTTCPTTEPSPTSDPMHPPTTNPPPTASVPIPNTNLPCMRDNLLSRMALIIRLLRVLCHGFRQLRSSEANNAASGSQASGDNPASYLFPAVHTFTGTLLLELIHILEAVGFQISPTCEAHLDSALQILTADEHGIDLWNCTDTRDASCFISAALDFEINSNVDLREASVDGPSDSVEIPDSLSSHRNQTECADIFDQHATSFSRDQSPLISGENQTEEVHAADQMINPDCLLSSTIETPNRRRRRKKTPPANSGNRCRPPEVPILRRSVRLQASVSSARISFQIGSSSSTRTRLNVRQPNRQKKKIAHDTDVTNNTVQTPDLQRCENTDNMNDDNAEDNTDESTDHIPGNEGNTYTGYRSSNHGHGSSTNEEQVPTNTDHQDDMCHLGNTSFQEGVSNREDADIVHGQECLDVLPEDNICQFCKIENFTYTGWYGRPDTKGSESDIRQRRCMGCGQYY